MNDQRLSYWHKQTKDNPLFPDLLWSRPENKRLRGKLLIIGGNLQTLNAPAQAYANAVTADAGSVRIMLPSAIKRAFGKSAFQNAIFAPSTPSGGFGKPALSDFLEEAAWADGVLIAGDLGQNSETAILIENFFDKFNGQLTLAQDSLDFFKQTPEVLLNRNDTVLTAAMPQLQKMASSIRHKHPFTSTMSLYQAVESLHLLTSNCSSGIIIKHASHIVVAVAGQVSTTPISSQKETTNKTKKDESEISIAAHAAVWRLQNPSKPFESMTTAMYQL